MATRVLDEPPSLLALYAKAVAGAAAKSGSVALPDTEIEVHDLGIDRSHVAAYNRVCGYRLADTLPPTYLHLLAFPLGVELMADRKFPFPLLGLVHLRNRITQHRPVTLDERVDIQVTAENLRSHDKGALFDLVARATSGRDEVWTGVSTYLRRGASLEAANETTDPAPPKAPTEGDPTAVWHVDTDIGRRYAAVSGDRNPIHLHPLTARLFGFKRHIVHGMWTKARTLAALEGRLPDAVDVDVVFKTPMYLPATVELRTEPDGKQGWRVGVQAPDGRPHLAGAVTPA